MSQSLQVVVLKPSKYTADGYVERFRRGFMPNSTLPYLRSMTPALVGDVPVEVHTIDEYVHTDLRSHPAPSVARLTDAVGVGRRAEPPSPPPATTR